MKHIFITILVLLFSEMAFGQVYPFRTYSIEMGLSESVVNEMMQDDEGWLWIATGYGLNRFDGFKFVNYYEENGLFSNKVYSLYQDDEGTIWIGTGAGVNIIEEDSITTHPDLSALKSSVILEIYEDSRGEYWFATDGHGVWHYDAAGGLTQYREVNGMSNDRVRDVVEDHEGTLWFGTRGGLTRLKDGNFRSYTTKNGLPDDKIRDLLLDKNGQLWIGTRGGLSLYQDGTFQNYTEADNLINNRIQSLSPDSGDGLWIGTEEGVSHLKNEVFKNYSVEQGLSNNFIYSTLLDREKNIWFGTFGGGISVFLGDHIQNFTIEEGLSNNVITSITEDNDGNHWITSYGGGISKYDGKNFTNYSERDGLVDNKVYTAIVDRQNRLMIGTRWGLSIFEDGTFYNFDESELPYRKIRAIEEDTSGEGYWMGTYGEGILHLKDGSFKHLQEQDGLPNNTVMSVKQDDEDAFWFATYGGVSRYQNGAFTNYSIRDGLPNNGILDILKDQNGNLWFSSFSGISMLQDGGGFINITEEDGLPDEVCYFILQDDEGIFWVGTKIGVVRFDYEIYKNAEDPAEKRKSFKLITQDQGLIANETNAGAGFKDKSGVLWFGTVGGLTRFNPKATPNNETPPIVHIENVQISGEPIEDRKAINVSSDNRNIGISYIGISYSAPEQILYEYRLRGSGEGWQQSTRRSVRYSALLPGDYTFQVRAQNNDGVWSTDTASLNFTVMAPFWMQWWFVLLVLIVLVGIIVFIYNYYRVKKMVDIERMRVRIASDLHDDVGSALTEIALQSDFLQTTDVGDQLKQSLDQIGTQSRKIVSSLDDIVWSIDARNDTLGDLTDRMQDYINNMLPQKEVKYQFDDLNMDNKVSVSMKENLYLIFKEAVNNIAKHSNADKVEVVLKNQNGNFDLYIHDNGQGIKPERKTGQGLRNMKMRAERIDADIEFKNETGFTVHVSGEGI